MALSDILFDASLQIERYRRESSDVYAEADAHIQYVLDHMRLLQGYYDIAPGHPYGAPKLTPPDQFFAPAREFGRVSGVDNWKEAATLFDWEPLKRNAEARHPF